MEAYIPENIEKKWQAYWEANKTFKCDLNSVNKKVYCLDMFPYPSGTGIHMGHPLGYTGTDIYCRFKKLQGYTVLHPMGYDAFGLPAEQYAISTGRHPGEFTDKNCEQFTKQLKCFGYSYDWDREVRTCHPEYYKWTQWIFLKLFNSWFDQDLNKARPISELPIPEEIKNAGAKAIHDYQAEFRLAYNAEADVNWCPALGTVLANEEVIDGKSERGGHDVFRKPMKQWLLRITAYTERLLEELNPIDWPESIKEQQRNWIGRSEGVNIKQKIKDLNIEIEVYDSIPQTFLAQTFCVIAPEHKLIKDLIKGTKQEQEVQEFVDYIAQKKLQKKFDIENDLEGIFTGRYLENPFGTGDLPIWIASYVLADYGTGMVNCSSHDQRDFNFAKKYNIPLKVAMLPKDHEEQVKVKNFEYSYLAPDGIIQEPAECRGMTWTASRDAVIQYMVDKGLAKRKVNYRLRDWLFSRQRYWGEPIPVIHWDDGITTALTESDLPLVLPEVSEYKPSEDGESPLARAKDWLYVEQNGRKGRRETNTMPQWAGSCWYYLRFIDPKNSEAAWDQELEKQMMPVDLYVGGAEHAVLHLLYARFWHKVLYDLGYVSTKEPFQRLYNQGMLVSHAFKDNRGALIPVDEVKEENNKFIHEKTGLEVEKITAKMSKSLKNVVNPDDIIKEFGADTLRMYLMFMGPLDAMKSWDHKAINGVHRFLKRFWSFIQQAKDNFVSAEVEVTEVKRAVNLALSKCNRDLEALGFNTCVSTMMECMNSLSDHKISKITAEKLLILLAPFAPHTTEELWESLGNKESIYFATWPTLEPEYLVLSIVKVVVQIAGKKRALLEVAVDTDDAALKDLAISSLKGSNYEINANDKYIFVRDAATKAPKLINVIKLSSQ